MKPASSSALSLAIILVISDPSLTWVVAADSPALPEPAVQPVHVAPISSGLMRKVYLALVRDSIVPADPQVVASAALAALPPEHNRSLPSGFGNDVEQDSAWLAERVADLPPPWLALEAMVRSAKTAHTALITPERQPALRALMSGHPLSAPGFKLHPLADGRFVASDLIVGASADIAGLCVGDVLNRIAGRTPFPSDAFWLCTLPAGTEVVLDLERAGRPLTITLQLQAADVPSVESRLLNDGIGYLRIRWFARTNEADRDSATLVRRALTSFAGQGASGLIIDLRSAVGGSGEVSMASAICDGDVIYSVRQPLASPARPVKREGAKIWPDRPVVVLINEFTVSAGEDLALALRELGHAKIVGRTSGGGLTEPSRQPLADSYGLIIPTGVVLGPVTGTDQPGHAVKPDIEVSNPDIADLLSGRDRQLEAARAALAGK